MESVLIQSNFPHRISLSQASQITGYHQDYLGLLCRLGKIEANKIGRNWYTTQSEINKFLNPEVSAEQMGFTPESEGLISESATTLNDLLSDRVDQQEVPIKQRSNPVSIDSVVISAPAVKRALAPTIVENVVISDMKSMPIRLVRKPVAAQHHNLQSIITRTKLEQLKQDVLQIAGFMDSVSNELAEHRSILQKHEALLAMRKDLATSYASNIDFGLNTKAPETKVTMVEDNNNSDLQQHKVVWLWPSLAISLVVIISLIVLGGAIPKASNYATTIYYKFTKPELNPQVAGETDTIQAPAMEIRN